MSINSVQLRASIGKIHKYFKNLMVRYALCTIMTVGIWHRHRSLMEMAITVLVEKKQQLCLDFSFGGYFIIADTSCPWNRTKIKHLFFN